MEWMNIQQWTIATVAAAVTMTIGFISYTHNYVFTRSEGASLTETVRVNTNDVKTIRSDIYHELQQINGRLGKIEGKISNQH